VHALCRTQFGRMGLSMRCSINTAPLPPQCSRLSRPSFGTICSLWCRAYGVPFASSWRSARSASHATMPPRLRFNSANTSPSCHVVPGSSTPSACTCQRTEAPWKRRWQGRSQALQHPRPSSSLPRCDVGRCICGQPLDWHRVLAMQRPAGGKLVRSAPCLSCCPAHQCVLPWQPCRCRAAP
jgi:hypothetical protein